MTEALLDLSAGRGTTEQHIASILLAKQVNQALGGFAVSPWEIGEIPDEWMDAFVSLTTRLPVMEQGRAKIDAAIERFRANHPNYRSKR